MSTASVIIGAIILIVATADILSTVVAVSGRAGPVSGRLALSCWRALLKVHERRSVHAALRVGGVAITIGTLLVWVVLLLVGWTLVFVDGSVVDTGSGVTTNAWGRLYFVGYSLFTMGNGDLAPASDGWRMVTVLANGMGLVLVTLVVSYLIPIVQAVVNKRSVATAIANLGMTADEILCRAWNGRDLAALEQRLADLALPIDTIAQQHLAYPSLHYQHATDPASALAPRLVALDDAMTILLALPEDQAIVDLRHIDPLRRAIGNLLDTLEPTMVSAEIRSVPEPAIEPLLAAGFPLQDELSFSGTFERVAPRRRRLAALLYHDGWNWDAVRG